MNLQLTFEWVKSVLW